jgi:O-antigen ligase
MRKSCALEHHAARLAPTHAPWLPQALVLVGLGYPMARMLLPGTVRMLALVPVLLLLLWLLWQSRRPRQRLHSPLGLPLLLGALALSASSLFAVDDGVAVLAQLLDWAELAVMLFLVIAVLAAGWPPVLMTRTVLLAISGMLLASAWVLFGWWIEWALLWQPGEPWLPANFRKAVAGNHPNQVGLLLNIGMPLAIAAMWRARAAWQHGLWGGWLLLHVLVIYHTSSRGAWLGMLVAAATLVVPLLWATLRARRWRRLLTTCGLGALYAAVFLTFFFANIFEIRAMRGGATAEQTTARLSGEESTGEAGAAEGAAGEESTGEESAAVDAAIGGLTHGTGRAIFWQRALEFFGERPLVGVGPGGYAFMYASVEPFSRIFLAEHAHSLYLTLLSEGGLLAVGALLVLGLTTLRLWWRGWRTADPLLVAAGSGAPTASQGDRLLLLACGAAALGMAAHGLVEVPVLYTLGMVVFLLAAALTAGGAWQLVPADSPRARWPASLADLVRGLLRVHPVHLALVLAALLAWGVGAAVLMQRSAQAAQTQATQAALLRGELQRALALSTESLVRYRWYEQAYSQRAIALAWLALEQSARLPAALAAQEQAARRDPTNLVVPLNRAALLLALERPDEAAAMVQDYIARDQAHNALPYLLLARSSEQQGDAAQAREHWQTARTVQPALAESAACLASAPCQQIAIRPGTEYAALVAARQLAAQDDPAVLAQIEAAAQNWDSIDIWAFGALVAWQHERPALAERYLTAARDQAEIVGNQPTPQLALALLHDAMRRDDRAAVRGLLQTWIGRPDLQLVPQLSQAQLTTTERELAARLVDAAAWLDDAALLEEARSYQTFVASAFSEATAPRP